MVRSARRDCCERAKALTGVRYGPRARTAETVRCSWRSCTPCKGATRLRYRPKQTAVYRFRAQHKSRLAVVAACQVVEPNLDDVAQEARQVFADVERGLCAEGGGDGHLDDARAELAGQEQH